MDHACGCPDHPDRKTPGGTEWLRAVLLGAVVLSTSPALAQQTNQGVGIGPSQEQAQPLVPVPPVAPTSHLFGDWGGLRDALDHRGIGIALDYTTENAAVVSGGIRHGIDYAHQIGLQVDLDWARIAGIEGLTTHGVIVNRAGRNAGTDFLGDNIIQPQELYGAGFDMAAHLVYLYDELKLANGRLDLEAGRLDVGNDFAASPLYCNFMLLAVCGHPRALQSEAGFTDWPQASWGGRIRVRPSDTTYVQFGAYEVKPYPAGGRSGFDWSLDYDTGVSVPVELGWEPVLGGSRALLGHYKVGYIYDNSNYADFLTGQFGLMQTSTGSLRPVQQRAGRAQFWITFDQMLRRQGPHQYDGLILLGAFAHADPHTSQISDLAELGLIDKSLWRSRPGDQLGLMAVYYHISNQLNAEETLETQLGEPLSGGALGTQSDAMVLEANYAVPVWTGVQVQPEIEYFVRPGATTHTPSALVLGLKTHVAF